MAASTSMQGLSGRLQGLKFMQRAKAREEILQKQAVEETVEDESHWVTPGQEAGASGKCVVIVEGDPKPGALLGRMSFQNFNPSVEKIVGEVEERRQRLRLAASTSNGEILSAGKAAEQADRNNGEHGLAVARDSSQGILRKRQKVEKVTVIKAETSSVTSISSVNPNVKAESERRLQQHETMQVKSNRDWRHLRPPGR